MYVLKAGIKKDPVRRWALPDRIFFGYGACAILAGVFLQKAPLKSFHAERIIPGDGHAGNHIYVTDGIIAFDYHGYSGRLNLLRHFTNAWSKSYGTGWSCRIERVEFDLLDTAELNQRKMLGPDQYVGDPVERAREFLGRFDHSASMARATSIARALHGNAVKRKSSPDFQQANKNRHGSNR